MSNKFERIYQFDIIKVFLALWGVFFHAGIPFNVHFSEAIDSPIFFSNQISGLTPFLSFTHLFRMHVFFLISGFFFSSSLKKHSTHEVLLKKFMTLAIPLGFFALTVLPGMFLLLGKPPFYKSPDYLWFLSYLFLLMVLVGAFFKWIPKGGLFPLLTSLVLLIFIFQWDESHRLPSPTWSWIPEGKTFVVYGLFFATGFFALSDSANYFAFMKRSANAFRLLFLLSFLLALSPYLKISLPSVFAWTNLALFPVIFCIWLYIETSAFPSLARKFEGIQNSSYAIFLFHKPTAFILLFYFSKIGLTGWPLYLSSVFLTSIFCFAISPYFLKVIKLLDRAPRFLNSKRAP